MASIMQTAKMHAKMLASHLGGKPQAVDAHTQPRDTPKCQHVQAVQETSKCSESGFCWQFLLSVTGGAKQAESGGTVARGTRHLGQGLHRPAQWAAPWGLPSSSSAPAQPAVV